MLNLNVDDAPIVAVDFDVTNAGPDQYLTFTTNVGDTAIAGPAHPIRIDRDANTGEPSPYIRIRTNLEALIDRKSFYRLVDIGTHHDFNGENWFGIWSHGQFFPAIPSAELA